MNAQTRPRLIAAIGMVIGLAAPAAAQNASIDRPAPAAEFTAGYAGFVDEGTVGHGVLGGALRFPLAPRLSVGPEIVYMNGPGDHSDLLITGNVTFDLVHPRRWAASVTPFLVGGFGAFGYRSDRFSSWEGGFTGGGGVRVWMTSRVYATGEFRIGWEPHYRVTGTIGVALK